MLLKKIVASIVAVALGLTIASCGTAEKLEGSENIASSKTTLNKLNNSETINATKALLSFGDNWEVTADGEKIGNVKGQAFYLIGDTYAFYNNDGFFVGAESENFRIVNHAADFYDYNGEKVGRLEQEIFHLLYHFNIYTGEKLVGTAEQNFSLTLDVDIVDSEGNKVWNIRSNIMSIHDNVNLTKLSDSDVTAEQALWTALAMSEIYQASKKKN